MGLENVKKRKRGSIMPHPTLANTWMVSQVQPRPHSATIVQRSQRNLETWKTWRFEYYLSRSRNSLEFIPKSQNSSTKQEIYQKTWIKPGMLRYTTFQYYIETIFFQVMYSCDFSIPLASPFWCKNCLQYNLENGFFDLDKTWR